MRLIVESAPFSLMLSLSKDENDERSPDGAQRNPGAARDNGNIGIPDYASLHPGYGVVPL